MIPQMRNDIRECTCGGGLPKIKYFEPYTWITCKKCCKTTKVYSDTYRKQDGLIKAIAEWTELVSEGKNV